MRILVSVLALTAGLAGCANYPGGMGANGPANTAGAGSDINIASLDPLDAPPPPMPEAAPMAQEEPAQASPPASDPLLLVPAQNQASQRVPLGTLNASSDPKPAAKPPTPLGPNASKTAPAPSTPAPSTPAPSTLAASTPAPMQTAAAPPRVTPSPPAGKPPVNSIPTVNQPAGSLTPPRPAPAPVNAPREMQAAEAEMPAVVAPAATAKAPMAFADEETMIISSTTASPAVQSREFIPAPVVPPAAAPPPPALGEMPYSQAEKNIARRFETLSRLRDEGLITQDEFNRRRAANLGAILPYSQDPPGVGLDRAVPSAEAIVARLGALRRSFEMRAITSQQHALERTMILNALLPESPEQRTVRKPPPDDVIQGAAMVGRLEALREGDVITQPELDAEKRMIDAVLRTGLFPPKGSDAATGAKTAAAKPAAANPATAAAPAAADTPMTREITGPVLHLASFRSEASAMKGWQEVSERNKATIGTLKPIIRRVDLGEGKGIFYRLMMGSFPSMAEAEATCVKLKQNSQFCRASADGS